MRSTESESVGDDKLPTGSGKVEVVASRRQQKQTQAAAAMPPPPAKAVVQPSVPSLGVPAPAWAGTPPVGFYLRGAEKWASRAADRAAESLHSFWQVLYLIVCLIQRRCTHSLIDAGHAGVQMRMLCWTTLLFPANMLFCAIRPTATNGLLLIRALHMARLSMANQQSR